MWCRQTTPRAWRLPLTALVAALAAGPLAAAIGSGYAGRNLAAVIDEIAGQGLRIFYSSDLVRPSMTVIADPAAADALTALSQILEPHGLTVRPGLNQSWLVVRRPNVPRLPTAEPNEPPLATPPLLPPPRPIEEIVVSASRYEIQGSGTTPRVRLTDRELELSPDIGDDAIRAVARLPGMASNGFNALANVRGGEIGETLVRLDGVRLYDPFHLKDFQGVFSVIDPRVVEVMDVYTGGFPAQYGDRMSGVIDVETMAAPDQLYHEVGLSFFNASFLSAGDFLAGRGGWLASVRRSNLDVLYDRFSEQRDGPRYTDAFVKLRFDVNESLSLTANLLRATDDIVLADDVDREEHATASQVDSYAWIRLDQELGGRTSGATVIASTSIDSQRSGTSEKSGVSMGWLDDARAFRLTALTSDWTRVVGSRSLLDFGGGMTWTSGRYRYRDAVSFDVLFDAPGVPADVSRSRNLDVRPSGRQAYVYGTLRSDLSDRFAIDVGVRVQDQDLEEASRATIGPRLGMRYALTPRMAVRASFGRVFQSQGINELQVSDGVTGFFRPQRSEHFVVGLDRQLAREALLRIEIYEKSMASLRPRYENLINTRVLLPELKPDRLQIWPDSARARGLEVSVEGGRDGLRWWGNLGWARVSDRIDGESVLRSWDQTWSLSTGFELTVRDWSLSSGLIYRSGWPTTPVALDADAAFPTIRAGQRNSLRMRPYGTLDVRLSREIRFDASRLSVFLELANLTGRENPCCFEYEIGDEDEAGLLVLDEQPYFPRIPSLGFTWAF